MVVMMMVVRRIVGNGDHNSDNCGDTVDRWGWR